MKIVYQSRDYSPGRVTGRYVRCSGRKPNYTFRVFETINGQDRWNLGRPGYGPTIREYDTDGKDLPDELVARAIASKMTEKWD